ncbi:T9SS type A sorting domain-containing protein [Fluviicola sp.]|uniref:T9SS type A sorting domain-containing protein n=1 Tax=Fluviicola sp. TaxID=1917219 RepID=UPI002616AA72|nr:T9SS type A sorting domain-containing protein [Fluviicola sp.]
MMKQIRLVTFLVGILTLLTGYSQNGGAWNNWYFGSQASLNFNNGIPTATTGSAMIADEGCVSYSDENGNLLFYSNGGNDGVGVYSGAVWNRNHQVMPNGNLPDMIGCSNSVQSALVIPRNGFPSQYYLYTIGCGPMMPIGLKESIIDMSLDNGLGDLVQIGTQVAPATAYAEGITGTRHANGTDYWIVVHHFSASEFYVFPHTAAGIGSATTYTLGSTPVNAGQLKISANGAKLAFGTEVFDFNNATGEISNPQSIGRNAYSRSFSPSGRFLYISGTFTGGNFFQYDMQAANIAASEVVLTQNNYSMGNMQLGPDGKIYIGYGSHLSLCVINSPESAGTACNFVEDQIPLMNNNCRHSIPNYMDSYYLEHRAASLAEKMVEFELYPNPATQSVTIHTPEQADEISISTITGQLVHTYQAAETITTLDLSSYKSGIYFVTVLLDGNRSVRQLVVN